METSCLHIEQLEMRNKALTAAVYMTMETDEIYLDNLNYKNTYKMNSPTSRKWCIYAWIILNGLSTRYLSWYNKSQDKILFNIFLTHHFLSIWYLCRERFENRLIFHLNILIVYPYVIRPASCILMYSPGLSFRLFTSLCFWHIVWISMGALASLTNDSFTCSSRLPIRLLTW